MARPSGVGSRLTTTEGSGAVSRREAAPATARTDSPAIAAPARFDSPPESRRRDRYARRIPPTEIAMRVGDACDTSAGINVVKATAIQARGTNAVNQTP